MKLPRLATVQLDDLLLDTDNPRFATLFTSKEQDKLIEYLLENEAASEVAQSIVETGYFHLDRPLWVIKKGTKYLVRDGNRRCAAVKALQAPSRYTLNLAKMILTELPVLIYDDEQELNKRIFNEHAHSTFRSWERIAKALEVYRIYSTKKSFESLLEYDSNPQQLIKLACFYFEAVKIGGEDFRKLIRRGKGKTGGKIIVFERLFSCAKECGFSFARKLNCSVQIENQKVFKSYILAITQYLSKFPNTTHDDVDKKNEQIDFLEKLKTYGFKNVPQPQSPSNTEENSGTSSLQTNMGASSNPLQDGSAPEANCNTDSGKNAKDKVKRPSSRKFPKCKRKQIHISLMAVIQESFQVHNTGDYNNVAYIMTRVVFEKTLKYILEETSYNNKKLLKYSYFDPSIRNTRTGYTNFTELKKQFTQLIKTKSIQQVFESFDYEKLSSSIHNQHITHLPSECKAVYANLLTLIEFMLETDEELLASLNLDALK